MSPAVQTSIYFWFGYPVPPKERMGLIADAGFDAVMLWWGDEYRAANGTKEQLPELARRRGLWVENIHVPFSDANLLWKDGVTAESVYARYLSCIDACRDHGIPVMVLHATQGNHPPPAGPTGLDRLRRLVERAQRQDVTIALENLRQSEHLDRAFEAIPSDRLGFCYDSGHENHFTKEWDLLDRYGHRLKALHLHDNKGGLDQHLPPGEGTIRWPWLMERIARTGYRGPVSLELSNIASSRLRRMPVETFLDRAHSKAVALGAMMTPLDGKARPDADINL